MSGPKVVRVVSREELLAEARAHLRAVDAALAQWGRTAQRHDAWTDERARTLAARRRDLERLVERDEWNNLRRAAAAEIAFLQNERERIATAAEDAAERAMRRRQRLGDAARGVARALKDAGRSVPPGLLTIGTRASRARDEDLRALELELDVAIRGLQVAGGDTEAQRSLAARLASGEQAQTLAHWSAAHGGSGREPDARLSRLLARLSVLAPEQAAPFLDRLEVIAQEGAANHRALLTDSLVLELAAHVERAREQARRFEELDEARSWVATIEDADARELVTCMEQIRPEGQVDEIPRLVAAARSLADADARRRAATARRHAVLQGLAALGYEVREHMQTAWATQGRVLVRRPGVSDYAVELGAPEDAERMQIRLVGSASPAEPRTTARDRDAEAQWCAQVSELRTLLDAHGSSLVIERALAAGATPVKTVQFDDSASAVQEHTEAPNLRERTR